MGEWLKPHASKACIRGTVSGVRIPLSPPLLSLLAESQHASSSGIAFQLEVVGIGVSLLVAAGFLLVSDEFKKFRAGRVMLVIATAWLCGKALMWAVSSSSALGIKIAVSVVVCLRSGPGIDSNPLVDKQART